MRYLILIKELIINLYLIILILVNLIFKHNIYIYDYILSCFHINNGMVYHHLLNNMLSPIIYSRTLLLSKYIFN